MYDDTHVHESLGEASPEALYIDPVKYEHALAMLPPRWADMVQLTQDGYTQAEIARLLGYTQTNIWYLLKRARRAMALILSLPQVTEASMAVDLADLFTPHELAFLRYYFRTSCYRHVMRLLNFKVDRPTFNTDCCAIRIAQYIERMKRAGPRYADYIQVFEAIQANPKVWADIRINTPKNIVSRDTTPRTDFEGMPPLRIKSTRERRKAQVAAAQVRRNQRRKLKN